MSDNTPQAPQQHQRLGKESQTRRAKQKRTNQSSFETVDIPVVGDNSTDTSLVTASGREVSAEEARDIHAMLFEAIGHYIDAHRFKLLMEPPPSYAVKRREGGGGAMYPYLKHGYVKLKLTQIFGIDWSHELLPFFAGEPYRLTPSDEAGLVTENASVTVYGRLTINIHVAASQRGGRVVDSNDALYTIVRTGFGSSEWRKKMELGDVLKAAQSDAFKVAAATLGPALGLTLYWDDEAELVNAENTDKQRRELERAWKLQQEARATKSPTSLAELLQRAKQDYGLSLSEVATRVNATISTLGGLIAQDPIGVWQRLKQSMDVGAAEQQQQAGQQAPQQAPATIQVIENKATQPPVITQDTASTQSAAELSTTPAPDAAHKEAANEQQHQDSTIQPKTAS